MTTLAPTSSDAVLRSLRVDRGSPVPLWFQVAQHLEDAITSGALPPGTLFGNEIQLADQLGLSRPTMRRAMQHLVDKGMIVRRRGIGTRVVQPTVRRPLQLTSLFDDLVGSGRAPTTRVLSWTTLAADTALAARLGVEEGTERVAVERLRSAQDVALARLTNYLPTSVVGFDAGDLAEHGLYGCCGPAGSTSTPRPGPSAPAPPPPPRPRCWMRPGVPPCSPSSGRPTTTTARSSSTATTSTPRAATPSRAPCSPDARPSRCAAARPQSHEGRWSPQPRRRSVPAGYRPRILDRCRPPPSRSTARSRPRRRSPPE